METNASSFWSRPVKSRLLARTAIQAASGDWGDSFGDGFVVTLRNGVESRVDVERAAARYSLRVVGEEWTVVKGRTMLRLHLSTGSWPRG